jgi:hypothetical protein
MPSGIIPSDNLPGSTDQSKSTDFASAHTLAHACAFGSRSALSSAAVWGGARQEAPQGAPQGAVIGGI